MSPSALWKSSARNAFSGVFRRSLLRFRNGGVPVTENAYMESIMSDLIPLFRPKSVALIGASSDTKKYGYWTAKSLSTTSFREKPICFQAPR